MSINSQVLPIDTCIEHITIKGQQASLLPYNINWTVTSAQLTAEYPLRAAAAVYPHYR